MCVRFCNTMVGGMEKVLLPLLTMDVGRKKNQSLAGNVRSSEFSMMGLMKCKCAVKEPSPIFLLVKQEKSKRNCDFLSPSKNPLPCPANVNSFRMDLYSLWSFLALLESLNLSFPVRINSLVCSSSITIAFSWTIKEMCLKTHQIWEQNLSVICWKYSGNIN